MDITYNTKPGIQMKKIVLFFVIGFSLLLIAAGISAFANTVEPSLGAEYENSKMFRSWSDPLMSIYWLMPFITSILLIWLWNFTKSLIKGDTILKRGIAFGFYYWIISVPGMIITYSTFQVSGYMVISWSLSGLAQALCAGIILARTQP